MTDPFDTMNSSDSIQTKQPASKSKATFSVEDDNQHESDHPAQEHLLSLNFYRINDAPMIFQSSSSTNRIR